MKLSKEIQGFCERIEYRFGQPELLIEALTHPSMESGVQNQRLEFLGDRVLGLVIAEALLEQDPNADEGALAPRLNALVRKETCADVARALELGAVLRMGRSEMLSGGRRKTAILGDAMEALIAAIYLDADYPTAQSFVLKSWGARLTEVKGEATDAKTALQEWAQARGEPPPSYVELDREGPDHEPIFTIEVRLQDGTTAQARASSKRAAQQAAALIVLEKVGA